jgi:hypothetical protein
MSGLLDFLQAASNSVAGNVSGPVDGINWLLSRAGLGSEEPVGGSKWLEKKGLTRPVKQGAAQVAGETAGLLSPVLMASKAPQIAKGLLQGADNLAASGHGPIMNQRGAIVYHGSPHKFDAFDSSKIGTGEGAQAYGHGLYLAENPAVAKDYAGALSAAKANRPVGNVDLTQAYQNLPNDVPETLLAARRDFRALNDAGELSAADRRDFLTAVKNNFTASQNGALYKVDLPDSAIAKMLDWDKPLSQQAPEVREAVRKLSQHTPKGGTYAESMQGFEFPHMTGESIERTFARDLATTGNGQPNKTFSMLLQEYGIPGIRYLDGGSRGAGAGTSNYVVFPGEEGLLKILERNGAPL